MPIKDYIQNKQPIFDRIVSQALSSGRLSHACLIVGEAGVPLKQVGMFLAKSLLCDNPSPYADENCQVCLRIDSSDYPDFRFFDGSESSIKKEEMQNVVLDFQQTPLERKGVMVYLIHLVENMTIEAANSLLKFLEEPNEGTYAILTTQNEAKVLPTIVSRCQTLHLLLLPRKEIVEEAMKIGVSRDDAELLSFFYNDAELVKEEAESEDFISAKESLNKFLSALADNPSLARFVAEKDVTPSLFSKASARFFFDLLSIIFQDVVSFSKGGDTELSSYAKIVSDLASKLPHVEATLLSIMTMRGEIETNIQIGLLIAHLLHQIYEGDTHARKQ